MAATTKTAATSIDSSSSHSDILDGVDQDNGGGREEGDVELALFRRIRSMSNMSALPTTHTFRNASYRHYFHHPLSMFTPGPNDNGNDTGDNSDSGHDSTKRKICPDSESNRSKKNNVSAEENLKSASTEVEWRDALIQACAALLGKSRAQLETDYVAMSSAASACAATFATHQPQFEPLPRDLADYAIITTLKHQDSLSMQNAASWLFNMMDRTGAGYVLRDEFMRYSPFITPVADFAVSGIVFDELVREQTRVAGEDTSPLPAVGSTASSPASTTAPASATNKSRKNDRSAGNSTVRQRHSRDKVNIDKAKGQERGRREPCDDDDCDTLLRHSSDPLPGGPPLRNLFPPGGALRFELWRNFFHAVQDKYHYPDEDWVRVKREVGIDPDETLIKSQGALDHSDLFPTLGKLYLSQRYLIFFAAVGRNHYVIRLGAVADISTDAIPFMMRDCMRITLESEVKVAIDGVSAVVKDDDGKNGENPKPDGENQLTQSQHVGKLMKKFSSGRKPLIFSLLEFRIKKRRDNWVNLVREMVSAHKLHAQLGFGSSGRMVRTVQIGARKAGGIDLDIVGDKDNDEADDKQNEERKRTQTLNYSRSPFRNEPSPPLLAVAAHSNIVRYRALRRVTEKRVSHALLIFSRAERNASLVNWYIDSVRAYESQSGRTWIERALAVIRDNMDSNDRIYRIEDDEPFDVGKLGDAIGRFAELCAPMARVLQFFNYLIQWRNPSATILAILVCMAVAVKGLVHYVPAFLFFSQAVWIVETKYNVFGLRMAGLSAGDAKEEERNVLELVAQVHDTLAAAQNVLSKLNGELGKVQAVSLWGCENDFESWIAVGALCFAAFILALLPLHVLFVFLVFFMFFKHFLPPSNPALRYWQSLPTRIVRQGMGTHPKDQSKEKKTVKK